MNFSTAARILRVLVRKRLLANGGSDIVSVSSLTAER
jgi:hypothetical protein